MVCMLIEAVAPSGLNPSGDCAPLGASLGARAAAAIARQTGALAGPPQRGPLPAAE